jgi:hypothetical protein
VVLIPEGFCHFRSVYSASHVVAFMSGNSGTRRSTCHSEYAWDGVRVHAVLNFLCLISWFCFSMLHHVDRVLNTVRISNFSFF